MRERILSTHAVLIEEPDRIVLRPRLATPLALGAGCGGLALASAGLKPLAAVLGTMASGDGALRSHLDALAGLSAWLPWVFACLGLVITLAGLASVLKDATVLDQYNQRVRVGFRSWDFHDLGPVEFERVDLAGEACLALASVAGGRTIRLLGAQPASAEAQLALMRDKLNAVLMKWSASGDPRSSERAKRDLDFLSPLLLGLGASFTAILVGFAPRLRLATGKASVLIWPLGIWIAAAGLANGIFRNRTGVDLTAWLAARRGSRLRRGIAYAVIAAAGLLYVALFGRLDS